MPSTLVTKSALERGTERIYICRFIALHQTISHSHQLSQQTKATRKMTLSKLALPTERFRGLVEKWYRNVPTPTTPCSCEELGLPIEECICNKAGVGAPPPPSSAADSEGPPQEVSTCGSRPSSIAPTEHLTSVFDTEFSEIMNDPDRDFESTLNEDPSLHPDSYTATEATETTDGQSTHDGLNENSASYADSEGDDETLVEKRSNCSVHSGLTAEFEDCLAAELEAAVMEGFSEPSTPPPASPQSPANPRPDSPSSEVSNRETGEPTTKEGCEEPGSGYLSESHLKRDPENKPEGGNSGDERPKKQRKLA